MRYYNYTVHYELCKVDNDGFVHEISTYTDKNTLHQGLFARDLCVNFARGGSFYSPRARITADGGDIDYSTTYYPAYAGDCVTPARQYTLRRIQLVDPVTEYLEHMGWSSQPDVRRLATLELSI